MRGRFVVAWGVSEVGEAVGRAVALDDQIGPGCLRENDAFKALRPCRDNQ